jgi:hypothetical protein
MFDVYSRRGSTVRKLLIALAAGLVVSLGTGTTVAAKAGHHHRALVHGVVQSVSSDSITITRRDGSSMTIGVTSRTRVVVNHARATIAAVKVGFRALVAVGRNGKARAIRASNKSPGGLHQLLRGVVKTVGTDSITLQVRSGDLVTVQVTAQTQIVVDRHAAAIGDIQVGYRAFVFRAPGGGPALGIVAHAPRH